jgi:hypothetical protein
MFATGVSFLASIPDADAAARARGPDRVGNMKRIVIPEKGDPVTTIAPNGSASKGAANSAASGKANPTPFQVPVGSMIKPGIEKGGPMVLPGVQ